MTVRLESARSFRGNGERHLPTRLARLATAALLAAALAPSAGTALTQGAPAPGTIATVAGDGTAGYGGDGGPAIYAQLNAPADVALAPDGSLFISDTRNNRIRKVGTDGVIRTVAGNGRGIYSGDGGPAVEAGVAGPTGITAGPDGSVYFVDPGGIRIRRISSTGSISTVAGNGQRGSSGDGGPARAASFSAPQDVALGPDGSLYIADLGARRIRRVAPDGTISTFAGNGEIATGGSNNRPAQGVPATQLPVGNVVGVGVGPDGSVYVSKSDGLIARVRPDGTMYTLTGATNAHGLAGVADGGVFYVEYPVNRVRYVAGEGKPSRILVGSQFGDSGFAGDGGPGVAALLRSPNGLAADADHNVLIADAGNNRIRRVWGDSSTPAIRAVTPLPEQTAVAVRDSVIVAFTKAIAFSPSDYGEQGRFQLRGPGERLVVASATYDPLALLVEILPAGPLQPDSRYTLSVSGGRAGVADYAGRRLATDLLASFRTACANGWLAAVGDASARLGCPLGETAFFQGAEQQYERGHALLRHDVGEVWLTGEDGRWWVMRAPEPGGEEPAGDEAVGVAIDAPTAIAPAPAAWMSDVNARERLGLPTAPERQLLGASQSVGSGALLLLGADQPHVRLYGSDGSLRTLAVVVK